MVLLNACMWLPLPPPHRYTRAGYKNRIESKANAKIKKNNENHLQNIWIKNFCACHIRMFFPILNRRIIFVFIWCRRLTLPLFSFLSLAVFYLLPYCFFLSYPNRIEIQNIILKAIKACHFEMPTIFEIVCEYLCVCTLVCDGIPESYFIIISNPPSKQSHIWMQIYSEFYMLLPWTHINEWNNNRNVGKAG